MNRARSAPAPRQDILPRRAGESDKERRLRGCLNRIAGQAFAALDAAIEMRTAPQEAQAARNKARNMMTDFCTKAMLALAFAEEPTLPREPIGDQDG